MSTHNLKYSFAFCDCCVCLRGIKATRSGTRSSPVVTVALLLPCWSDAGAALLRVCGALILSLWILLSLSDLLTDLIYSPPPGRSPFGPHQWSHPRNFQTHLTDFKILSLLGWKVWDLSGLLAVRDGRALHPKWIRWACSAGHVAHTVVITHFRLNDICFADHLLKVGSFIHYVTYCMFLPNQLIIPYWQECYQTIQYLYYYYYYYYYVCSGKHKLHGGRITLFSRHIWEFRDSLYFDGAGRTVWNHVLFPVVISLGQCCSCLLWSSRDVVFCRLRNFYWLVFFGCVL